jgi:hypothetical protein
MPLPDSIIAARKKFEAARVLSQKRLAALVTQETALRDLLQSKAPSDAAVTAAKAAVDTARQALWVHRAEERKLKDSVQATLDKWFKNAFPAGDIGEVGELTTRFPIGLFPVQLQTRFDPPGQPTELLVRIYPDTIATEIHEPLLTPSERQAGQAYWSAGWVEADEAEAWRALLLQFPPARAAWIVRQTAPSNLDQRPDGEPKFQGHSAGDARPTSWTMPAEARLLPDRWLVVAYRGGVEVKRAVSAAVRLPLSVSPDPSESDPTQVIDVSGDGLRLDVEMLWLVDFRRAERAGMAVRIGLSAADVSDGFDELIAVGVKASVSPEEAADQFARLLEGHHYGLGLAFVPQGTPTNNTSERPSGFPPSDLGGRSSFALERSGLQLSPDNDGPRLAAALGLTGGARAEEGEGKPPWSQDELPHLAGADGWDQRRARAMQLALWPISRYSLEQMLAPGLARQVIQSLGQHAHNYVRGRGPYPAIRVGETPYAMLPISLLDQWKVAEGARGLSGLPKALLELRKYWKAATSKLTRIGGGGNPDQELLDVLGMEASAREVRLRGLWGADLMGSLLRFAGTTGLQIAQSEVSSWTNRRAEVEDDTMTTLTGAGWGAATDSPRIARASLKAHSYPFRYPLVTSAQLSDTDSLGETAGKDANYISWIRRARLKDLRQAGIPDDAPLLLLLLRHAMLLQYLTTALDILGIGEPERREAELLGIELASGLTRGRPLDYLDQSVHPQQGSVLNEYLSYPPDQSRPGAKQAEGYRENLGVLASLPTGELERLMTETLDTWSHRIDPWITSLATERLASMRDVAPHGCHIGAFGWVEKLKPIDPSLIATRKLSDGRTVYLQHGTGGYIHAPSMTHAATASVLRSGFLNREAEANQRVSDSPPKPGFALNLSSVRVREALSLLDAVRQGQHFGTVLGYRIERSLHEGSLETLIAPLRRHFPLVANKGKPNTGPVSDTAVGRNVLDGLALWRHWSTPNSSWPTSLNLSDGQPNKLKNILSAVTDSLDAVADLLLAESVHQMVRGNTTATGASLESMAAGMRPPEPDIAATPRGGPSLTHRLLLILGEGTTPAATGWSATLTPRARAEPRLEAWVEWLLGDPTKAKCVVRYPRSRPEAERKVRSVTLADLRLRALDVLALAGETAAAAQAGELDRRVVDSFLTGSGVTGLTPEDLEITYTVQLPDRLTERSFYDVLELARSITRVVGGARPLRPADLVPPGREEAAAIDLAELKGRAVAAKAGLEETLDTLRSRIESIRTALEADSTPPPPDKLLDTLRRLALYGIPGAYPVPGQRNTVEVLSQAESVEREAQRKLDAANAKPEDDASGIMKDIFGSGFVVLPRFTPPLGTREELDRALAVPHTGSAPGSDAAIQWLQQAARVRAPLARWRRLGLYSRALGIDLTKFTVAQLPYAAGEQWAALKFVGAPAVAGRLSLVLHRFAAPSASNGWVGLTLDEWSEVIPRRLEETGVVFHYDDPGAEPPHAVLIAVPPDLSVPTWSSATLLSIVRETFELVKIRGVEAEMLDGLGQLVPGIFTAANQANATVQIPFIAQAMWTGDLS